MKKLTLTPAQVLTTSELAPEDSLSLRIYYQVFKREGGHSLPPIIVGTIKSPSEWISRLEQGYSRWERSQPDLLQTRRREYRVLFQKLRVTPYYILDGNHRALAAALNRRELNVLQLDADRDLFEIERMVTRGDLFPFPHQAQSVDELEGLFIKHVLNLNDIPPHHALVASQKLVVKHLVPVATHAYELCTSNLLPRYMVRQYSQRPVKVLM